MGGFMTKTMGQVMDDNMKKQQEFMLATQKMQLERQFQMQIQMRNRMMAQQLAGQREMMNWWGSFYALAALGLTAGFLRTKNPAVLSPLLPLTFLAGYQADLAWGNKMDRILAITEDILEKEQGILRLPGEPLSVALLDRERMKTKGN